MNVVISSATGAVKIKAKLVIESGVLLLEDGTISCVPFELQFGKRIVEEKPVENKKEVEPLVEQSEPSKEKKTKSKSK